MQSKLYDYLRLKQCAWCHQTIWWWHRTLWGRSHDDTHLDCYRKKHLHAILDSIGKIQTTTDSLIQWYDKIWKN